MKTDFSFVCGLPQLDVYTLSEDHLLAISLEAHWKLQAKSLGLAPSKWIDGNGERMYSAVMWLSTTFDLTRPVAEDDTVDATCEMVAVRKPHGLSLTRYAVGGVERASVTLLTSFIVRRVRGSNKKFSKTKDLWTEPDVDEGRVNDILDEHHHVKSQWQDVESDVPATEHLTEVNRIRDFNTADFMYFKNFVLFAKAAEWAHNRRQGETRLNLKRDCWYFGNVEDGDVIRTTVREVEPNVLVTAHHAPDGRRIFVSRAAVAPVTIAPR